ncbi:C-_U-editing enzyme APOBEC-2a [Astyanax mexicanus]|uniref:C->U-editing enzyme APOBEC-2-like n=1 Tax=Astyanax mexicanus TaxID=7994 RepID=A0A8T2KNF1_ASTMX|nr:C->U-editing enzyme APOBEC-2a [Astyanax mexicanus]KAG9260734.1 C->U-editing enzyme APOBEC-2-like [Astyanax mexicanus]
MAEKGNGGVSSRLAARRKEKAGEKKEEKKEEDGGKVNGNGKNVANGDAAVANGAPGEPGLEKPEPMELPPFETITGDRMDPFSFRFQFKNVEYCSGRNKTLLCYLVDQSSGADGLLRGFLEDEHAGLHAELAFFQLILPQYDPSVNYTVTWYVSSSPCAHCCSKLLEILQERKTLRLNIFSARLLEAEEEEGQEDNRAGMKALAGAGCKLRVMKPLDFSYSWDTFVEHEDERFTPWEDCQENYEYHHEKLAQILE